ncbi:MAG: GNAT family N-acetyltransferase [Tepidiformaceae bacterium]
MQSRSPSVTLEPAEFTDKSVLRNLLQLYLHDFSEFTGEDVGPDGLYGYHYLDHYWTDPDRYPFFIRVEGVVAGFVLVRATAPYDMAEFFVMRKYRRLGVGSVAANLAFERFPGPWQVRELLANLPAQAFWRRVIGAYTGGAFAEHRDEEEVVQTFDRAK